MQVATDIDCPPKEAHRFLGLPGLGPGHQAYVTKPIGGVADGATLELFADMMKRWGLRGKAGLSMWPRMPGRTGGGSR